MKRIKVILLLMLLIVPMKLFASEKVKVYIFEAGGCPYCEMEKEYLKGLDGYNNKFEIVVKELYKDHVNWEEGKDYALGVKLADLFYRAGFTGASANSTPFVIISNLYASSSYSTALEDIINQAYNEGDKDVVSCVETDKLGNCLEGSGSVDTTTTGTKGIEDDKYTGTEDTITTGETTENTSTTSSSNDSSLNLYYIVIPLVIMIIIFGLLIYVVIKKKKSNSYE